MQLIIVSEVNIKHLLFSTDENNVANCIKYPNSQIREFFSPIVPMTLWY